MSFRRYRHIVPILLVALIMVTVGCSTQKNTAQSRWWHSFNANYNTYFNGSQAYIDGSLEKENGNKDNFTELIPLYTVGNKASRELGKANFDRAIEKSQKAIHKHSIKKRPEWTKSRKKTEKDIEWLSRREYNPFLWKAWMLMGRSQFHKGAFDEAAATFSYMSRLYSTQPAIYGKARAWLAKCYVEEGWLYDAEDVIRNMQRDSLHWRAVKEWDYTYADYYIHTGEFDKAIPYLRKVIKHEMRRKQRAREWYLMGQLQAAVGNKTEAYKAFKHVIRQNPPYELEFNARISMTEVMATGRSKQMVGRLKRMAASDNNKEYLDQVYYAMGNIYLAEKDTTKAIEAYEKGNEKATRSGIEKGVLLLHLGDLYWAKEKYGDAKRCYGEAIGLLDKERKDYKQLSDRSKVLDELVPYTDAVYLQDSLQALAAMPEEERNKAIDRVIDALKKKEREERKLQAQAEAEKAQSQNGGNINNTPATPTGNQQEKGLWYFYNQMAVNQGKTTFQRQWGKRENIDDWQRINKTVVGTVGSTSDAEELTDEQRDSIFAAEQLQDSLAQIADSVQNDPHKREYYLKQIPFTPEQIAESNNIITDGLHHAGVIFKDKLDNLPLGEKNLRRLADNYPDYENMDDVYYHLYLLYSRLNRPQTAESYVDMLKNKFPESKWTALLSDPYFKENARFGTHIEDSIYTATYEAFKKDRYNEVAGNVRVSETRFPLGANRDKFLFIGGLNKLNNGDAEGCLADMKTVVEKYPQSRISEMAGMIINGVNAGRRLRGGRFSLGDVWTRRNVVLNDNDTTKREAFSPDRLADFKFLLVYSPDSVDENKLLFEMAKFNFTHFVVRNFDIEIADLDGLHQMQLSGFRSFDEAYQYAREMYDTKTLAQLSAKAKAVIISDKNQKLLETYYSYKDYEDFYAKHFAPLTVSKRYLLSEPAEVATPRERDLEEEISSKAPTQDDIDDMMEGGTPVDTGFEIPSEDEAPASPTTVPNDETVIPNDDIAVPAEETAVPNNETIIIPNEEIDVPAEETTPAEPQTTVIETPQIPVETPDKPVDAQQGKPNKAPKKLTETPKEPVETPKKPVEVPQDKPVEPTTPAIEEDVFIFNDDETGVPQNNNTKTQPQNFDIEDEYYELDGF